MAMTPEAKVKAQVIKQLKELGVYYFSPVTGGYGRSGVPDIVGCMNGRFFAIEWYWMKPKKLFMAIGRRHTGIPQRTYGQLLLCGKHI